MKASMESFFSEMGFGWFNVKIFFIIGMFWMMEGIEMNLISLMGPKLQCEWNLSNIEKALTSVALFVGMCLGHFIWGWLGDRIGRKKVLLGSSVLTLSFGLLTAAAPSLYWFLLLRFFVGIGVAGVASGMCYLIELNSFSNRARVIVGAHFFYAFGSFYAAFISYLVMTTWGWKAFLLLCTIPIPIVIALLTWLPESIRYLQNTGKYDEITKIMDFAAGENNSEKPSYSSIDCIEENDRGNISALFDQHHRLSTFLLCILWSSAWWIYFGLVLLNTGMLQNGNFQNHNVTSGCYALTTSDYLQNLFISLGEFPFVILCLLIIECIGRRYMLGLFFGTGGVCLFVLAFPLNSKVLTAVMFICRGVCAVLPQILYTFTLELYPTTIRNTALGFCTSVGRLVLTAIPFLVDMLVGTAFTYLIGVLCTLSVLCALLSFLLVETRGSHLLTR